MRAAIYLRVSTDEQTTDNQERELRAAAERIGHEVVAVYRDAGISGSKGRDQRPGFDAMHKDAARRRFDVVMAWSVDRLGRSLQDLCGFLSELHSLGIDLFLHQQGIDTTTPAGKAMFQMMGVFAEFERAMIRERVNAGIARAKAGGKHCGRPFIDTKLEGRIRAALAAPDRLGCTRSPSSSASARARCSVSRRCDGRPPRRRLVAARLPLGPTGLRGDCRAVRAALSQRRHPLLLAVVTFYAAARVFLCRCASLCRSVTMTLAKYSQSGHSNATRPG
jgi:DNA invertase Pin-like site-specific DNA recombinase